MHSCRTIGHSGPATLHYLSKSTFSARKELVISNFGLKALSAEAKAPTKLTPTEIHTSLPGLRGIIAQRIARRRAAQSQAEANAIASQHRARDIGAGLDDRLDHAIASIETRMKAEFVELEPGKNESGFTFRSRSTPDFVEVALLPPGFDSDQFQMPKFNIAENTQLAVRLHRTLLTRVLANEKLRARFAVFATALQEQPNGTFKNSSGIPLPALAIGSEWVAFDLPHLKATRAVLRIADTDERSRNR